MTVIKLEDGTQVTIKSPRNRLTFGVLTRALEAASNRTRKEIPGRLVDTKELHG